MTLHPPDVYVKETGTPKGRGVFAARPFAVGDVVEVCPVVPVRKKFDALPKELRLVVYSWETLAGAPADTHAVALGYGSLYNHNNPSNLRYEAAAGGALLLRLIAVRDIGEGEELTINYSAEGGGAVADEDWWFEEKRIKLITN